jgi:hypothetical protein
LGIGGGVRRRRRLREKKNEEASREKLRAESKKRKEMIEWFSLIIHRRSSFRATETRPCSRPTLLQIELD